ncbi:PAAR domain-containing protein [Massilia violaceinigra]|uniref:PAAR domain-containing protein n=1 Tax=Massilia violaceinigra TaxID=2045208 RepID=A0ABY4AE97_9BURK|nr:PAAR domain-containing protein [Massilia violaceinigra]UOD31886.1 PAAR domain-containing protein [Massilia violaceinigra]
MGKASARQTDDVAHNRGSGAILEGSANVLIGSLPAARIGDKVQHNGARDTIVEGEKTVLINGKPAACMSDRVSCHGIISGGCMTVLFGKDKHETCLIEAAEAGAMMVQPGN